MKDRHSRSIPEKYGLASVLKEADLFLKSFKPYERDTLDNFEKLPYLGILYVPYESTFLDLIYAGEDGELFKNGTEYKKFKVLEVTENDWVISHWDDHHHHIVIWRKRYDSYTVEGNELKRNEKTK